MTIRTTQVQGTRITAAEFPKEYVSFSMKYLLAYPPQNMHIIFTMSCFINLTGSLFHDIP
jgi:hypothetical protein